MPQFPPDRDDVVVVSSEPSGDEGGDGGQGRTFALEQGPDGGLDLDPARIRHEDDLVATMKEHGYTLTMVGGGSGSGDVRRFYFRELG